MGTNAIQILKDQIQDKIFNYIKRHLIRGNIDNSFQTIANLRHNISIYLPMAINQLQNKSSTLGRNIKIPRDVNFWKLVQQISGMINYAQILSTYGFRLRQRDTHRFQQQRLRSAIKTYMDNFMDRNARTIIQIEQHIINASKFLQDSFAKNQVQQKANTLFQILVRLQSAQDHQHQLIMRQLNLMLRQTDSVIAYQFFAKVQENKLMGILVKKLDMLIQKIQDQDQKNRLTDRRNKIVLIKQRQTPNKQVLRQVAQAISLAYSKNYKKVLEYLNRYDDHQYGQISRNNAPRGQGNSKTKQVIMNQYRQRLQTIQQHQLNPLVLQLQDEQNEQLTLKQRLRQRKPVVGPNNRPILKVQRARSQSLNPYVDPVIKRQRPVSQQYFNFETIRKRRKQTPIRQYVANNLTQAKNRIQLIKHNTKRLKKVQTNLKQKKTKTIKRLARKNDVSAKQALKQVKQKVNYYKKMKIHSNEIQLQIKKQQEEIQDNANQEFKKTIQQLKQVVQKREYQQQYVNEVIQPIQEIFKEVHQVLRPEVMDQQKNQNLIERLQQYNVNLATRNIINYQQYYKAITQTIKIITNFNNTMVKLKQRQDRIKKSKNLDVIQQRNKMRYIENWNQQYSQLYQQDKEQMRQIVEDQIKQFQQEKEILQKQINEVERQQQKFRNNRQKEQYLQILNILVRQYQTAIENGNSLSYGAQIKDINKKIGILTEQIKNNNPQFLDIASFRGKFTQIQKLDDKVAREIIKKPVKVIDNKMKQKQKQIQQIEFQSSFWTKQFETKENNQTYQQIIQSKVINTLYQQLQANIASLQQITKHKFGSFWKVKFQTRINKAAANIAGRLEQILIQANKQVKNLMRHQTNIAVNNKYAEVSKAYLKLIQTKKQKPVTHKILDKVQKVAPKIRQIIQKQYVQAKKVLDTALSLQMQQVQQQQNIKQLSQAIDFIYARKQVTQAQNKTKMIKQRQIQSQVRVQEDFRTILRGYWQNLLPDQKKDYQFLQRQKQTILQGVRLSNLFNGVVPIVLLKKLFLNNIRLKHYIQNGRVFRNQSQYWSALNLWLQTISFSMKSLNLQYILEKNIKDTIKGEKNMKDRSIQDIFNIMKGRQLQQMADRVNFIFSKYQLEKIVDKQYKQLRMSIQKLRMRRQLNIQVIRYFKQQIKSLKRGALIFSSQDVQLGKEIMNNLQQILVNMERDEGNVYFLQIRFQRSINQQGVGKQNLFRKKINLTDQSINNAIKSFIQTIKKILENSQYEEQSSLFIKSVKIVTQKPQQLQGYSYGQRDLLDKTLKLIADWQNSKKNMYNKSKKLINPDMQKIKEILVKIKVYTVGSQDKINSQWIKPKRFPISFQKLIDQNPYRQCIEIVKSWLQKNQHCFSFLQNPKLKNILTSYQKQRSVVQLNKKVCGLINGSQVTPPINSSYYIYLDRKNIIKDGKRQQIIHMEIHQPLQYQLQYLRALNDKKTHIYSKQRKRNPQTLCQKQYIYAIRARLTQYQKRQRQIGTQATQDLGNIYSDRLFYIDIQTLAVEQQYQPLLSIATIVTINGQIEKKVFDIGPSIQQSISSQQVINDWAQWVVDTIERQSVFDKKVKKSEWRMYAYNGFRFDYVYLKEALANKIVERQQNGTKINQGGTWDNVGDKLNPKAYVFKWPDRSELNNQLDFDQLLDGVKQQQIEKQNFFQLKLIDCLSLISGGLGKNSGKYNKFYKKLDYDIGKIKTYVSYFRERNRILEYNIFDCFSMKQLMENIYFQLWQIVNQQVKKNSQVISRNICFKDLMSKYTAASISLLYFNQCFLGNEKILGDKQQILQIQKDNYYGGITQVYSNFPMEIEIHGQILNQGVKKVYQLDFNSQYPTVMGKYPFPVMFINKRQLRHEQSLKILQTLKVRKNLSNSNYWTSLFKVKYFKLKSEICFIPFRTGLSQHYPNQFLNTTDRWLWGTEINCLLQNGDDVQIQQIIQYANHPYGQQIWLAMSVYANHMFAKKAFSKANQQAMKQTLFKLFMNSLYGKYGQKYYPKIMYQFVNGEWEALVKQQRQKQQNQQTKQKRPPFHIGTLIRFASFISATSRTILAHGIRLVGGRKNTFYMDTDSIYTNQEGYNLAIKNRLIGDELGMLKLQRMLQKVYFIGKKAYVAKISYTQQQIQKMIAKGQTIKYWTIKSKGISTKQPQKENLMKNLMIGMKYEYFGVMIKIMKLKSEQWQRNKKISQVIILLKNKWMNMIYYRKPFIINIDGKKYINTIGYSYETIVKILKIKNIEISMQQLNQQVREILLRGELSWKDQLFVDWVSQLRYEYKLKKQKKKYPFIKYI